MRPTDALAHLFDVAQACDLMATFTAGKDFDDYAGDPMLRSAVERQFEIVGEALKRAVAAELALELRISDVARIVAFRNRLIHGYATVSDAVVWGILETNLARLRREVGALLSEAE